VEPSGGGTSLGDLLARIASRLLARPDLELRVQVTAAEALGSAFQESLGDRFDRELAQASLRFYDARSVPCVCESLPPAVSEVRFTADLSASKWLPHDEMNSGPLYSAA
jgi:hypothetical protein